MQLKDCAIRGEQEKLLEIAEELARDCSRKLQLTQLIHRLSDPDVLHLLVSIDSHPKMTSLLELIREKILTLLLQEGDVIEDRYLLLFPLYDRHPLSADPRFDKYATFIRENYQNDDLGDIERSMLSNLWLMIEAINGRAESGLAEFVQRLCLYQLHLVEQVKLSSLMLEFFKEIDRVAIRVVEAIRPLYEKERYFSLSTVQQRSIFNWSLHVLWNIPSLYNSPEWTQLESCWMEALRGHIERNECDMAMYVHFYIYHKLGNSYQTQEDWQRFNETVDLPASRYYKQWGEQHGLAPSVFTRVDGRIRIAIIKDRIVDNSVFRVEYSLLKALQENPEFRAQYEIAVYTMNYFEKSEDNADAIKKLLAIGVPVVDCVAEFMAQGFYYSHLQKALKLRETILHDRIAILIASCNNFDVLDFLLVNRTAPAQVYWSHGNLVYDIEGIDRKMTHHRLDAYGEGFSHLDLALDESALSAPIAQKTVEELRAEYPKDSVLLGCIGRLVKVDSEPYLEMLASILKRFPQALFIACGSGNVDSIRTKLESLGIADRVVFTGYIDQNLYGRIIDLYLDTYPLGGGQSIKEYVAKESGIYVGYGAIRSTLVMGEAQITKIETALQQPKKRQLWELAFQELGESIEGSNAQEIAAIRNRKIAEHVGEVTMPASETEAYEQLAVAILEQGGLRAYLQQEQNAFYHASKQLGRDQMIEEMMGLFKSCSDPFDS